MLSFVAPGCDADDGEFASLQRSLTLSATFCLIKLSNSGPCGIFFEVASLAAFCMSANCACVACPIGIPYLSRVNPGGIGAHSFDCSGAFGFTTALSSSGTFSFFEPVLGSCVFAYPL